MLNTKVATWMPARLTAAALLLLTISACGHSHHTATHAVAPASTASTAPTSAPVSPPSTAGATNPVPAQQQSAIAVGLSAAQPTAVAAVLASSVAAGYLASPVALLPAGSHMTIDWSRIAVSGQLASVPAVVTGARPAAWTLLLIDQDGKWLVYGTQQGAS